MIDVLVVGAGPVGTALTLDLLRRGTAVSQIDRADGPFAGSRAKGVQPRTLEVFEDLDVLGEIQSAAAGYPRMGIHIGPLTVPLVMQKSRPRTPEVPYPDVVLSPQYHTDDVLRAAVQSRGLAADWATELVGLEIRVDHVVATVARAGHRGEIKARYLVGADGGASTTRKLAGIEFHGRTDDQDHMILADGPVPGLMRNRWHVWPGRAGQFLAVCPLPGSENFQFILRLARSDDPGDDPDTLRERVRDVARRKGLKPGRIGWVSVFRPNSRLAEHYRTGRVLLAGDAAHTHPPTGAQGLNTGVQDAYNLGWKLGQVLAGAPEALLDSYEAERRPVAAAVLELSDANYDALDSKKISGLRRGDAERQLALTYAGGPLAPRAQRTATLHAGDRAPDGHIGARRLFELMRGPQFTVLAFGVRAVRAAAGLPTPTRGAQLRVLELPDPPERLAATYGVSRDTLVLIRPDGYIAAIAATTDAIAEALTRLTATDIVLADVHN